MDVTMKSTVIIQCTLSGDFDNLTAEFQDMKIPDTSERIDLKIDPHSIIWLGNYNVQRLYFKNCILSEFSDVFFNKFPYVSEIEVEDSIVEKIDVHGMKMFKNFKKLVVKNANVEEFTGTIFENFKNFTMESEKVGDEDMMKINGSVGLKEFFKSKCPEEGDNEKTVAVATESNQLAIADRPILKAKSSIGQPVSNAIGSSTSIGIFGSIPTKGNSSFSFNTPTLQSPYAISSYGHRNSNFGTTNANSTLLGSAATSSLSANSSFGGATAKKVCENSTENLTRKHTTKPLESDQKTMLKERNLKLHTMNANLTKELNTFREQIMKLETENKKLSSGILADLKKIFNDDNFKDMTVKVSYGSNEKEFKVHKILFAARSSVIAEEIKKSPAEKYELSLTKIPLPIFENLLEFIYNDTPPADEADLINIYAAAGQLNIVELKNLTAVMLMDKIDEKNALKILELSNKYGNEELRKRAFEKIKEILPEYKMSNEFSKNPEKIKVLLEMKKKMDEEFAKMQQDLEDIQVIEEEHSGSTEGTSDGYEVID